MRLFNFLFVYSSMQMIAVFATLHTPIAYTLTGVSSANGSSMNGGCPSECVAPGDIPVCECSSGNTSGVLIDGVSPILHFNQSTMWASALYTTQTDSNTLDLGFKFENRISLRGVELSVFYCPQWNIGPHTIEVRVSFGFPRLSKFKGPDGIVTLSNSLRDCSSLTRVAIATPSARRTDVIFIEFNSSLSAAGIYIGEVKFDNESFPNAGTPTSTEILRSTTTESSIEIQSNTIDNTTQTVTEQNTTTGAAAVKANYATTSNTTRDIHFSNKAITLQLKRPITTINVTIIVVPVVLIIIVLSIIFIILLLAIIIGKKKRGRGVNAVNVIATAVDMENDNQYETITNGRIETTVTEGEDNHYESIAECREAMTSIRNESYGCVQDNATRNEAYGCFQEDVTKNEAYGCVHADATKNEAYGCLQEDDIDKNESYGCLQEEDVVKNEAYGCLQDEQVNKNESYGCLQEEDVIKNEAYGCLQKDKMVENEAYTLQERVMEYNEACGYLQEDDIASMTVTSAGL